MSKNYGSAHDSRIETDKQLRTTFVSEPHEKMTSFKNKELSSKLSHGHKGYRAELGRTESDNISINDQQQPRGQSSTDSISRAREQVYSKHGASLIRQDSTPGG